jgi:hypothetical protein
VSFLLYCHVFILCYRSCGRYTRVSDTNPPPHPPLNSPPPPLSGTSRVFNVTFKAMQLGTFSQNVTIITEKGNVDVVVTALVTTTKS